MNRYIEIPENAVKLPQLYGIDKKKKVRIWNILSYDNIIQMSSGLIDGEQVVTQNSCKPKNTGRANATTPVQQARKEAKSRWLHQIKKNGYRRTIEEAKKPQIRPMKAKRTWDDVDIEQFMPMIAQPKLDGLRCLNEMDRNLSKLTQHSKGGGEYDVTHIKDQLEWIMGQIQGYGDQMLDIILDGELYVHGVPLETLNSWVRNYRPESRALELHVYDFVLIGHEEQSCRVRLDMLKRTAAENFGTEMTPDIKYVERRIVNSKAEAKKYHDEKVAEGYEGIMLRKQDKGYLYGHKCDNLIKGKVPQDDEFLIVDYREGSGTTKGCIEFECLMRSGNTFFCAPKMSYKVRKQMFEEGEKYIGQYLKVRYNGFTEKNKIPCFARGISLRLEKDMDNLFPENLVARAIARKKQGR